ncbi:hypothetical protein A3C91_01255 [Candidatus Azambacteria bacterium RIFCSPHIGHO2_02_FULL_52_12]|nr:MAG: hypothetical protein A3C91_01255 [Candidatus Azambacteria bacterium RIFCSPHIGHO2_02_FULL_52_12]OGD36391.1 MAG: hypothetical protein A2850_01815 [Candidatus Azambacteria bacterium RIFCSPHIGHO2_01_FULL_51_74]
MFQDVMAISEQDKITFTRNLSVMAKSGIPLLEAVLSEGKQARSADFKRALFAVAEDIRRGERFSAALAKHPGVFGYFYVHVIEAGERSGSLEQNLIYLFEQMSAAREFRKELTGALLYPAFILSAVVVVGSLMAYFVLPQLTGFLSSFEGAELPFVTRMVLAFSDVTQHYGPLIFPGLFAACALLYGILAQTRPGRDVSDAMRLHLPIIGGILQRAYLVQFSKMLATLLKSGIPMHESLAIVGNGLDNAVFKKSALALVPHILAGQPLSPFLDRSLFPPLYIQMMEVGEKSARIEQNLDYLAEFYRKEMEYRLKNILTSLEPLLLILVGAVVLFLALALFMPLYQTIGTL